MKNGAGNRLTVSLTRLPTVSVVARSYSDLELFFLDIEVELVYLSVPL